MRTPASGGSPSRRALLLVAVVLALTADDRHAGKVSDGRQMIRTAVALTETGSLGQARGAPRTVPRAEGDAVARYGILPSLAQVPAALLAPGFERALGPGASQPLFVLAPFLAVLAAAALAGRAAQLLGADPRTRATAVLLAGLGSPLGAYATSDFSEPLQAACLGLAYVLALASATLADRSGRTAAGAGAAVSLAVLTKTSLLVAAPLALLPLLAGPARTRTRRLLLAGLGSAPGLGLWAALEVHRFGALAASYGGEGFSHPALDGLWRLLVGPNKGLVLFFPATLLALLSLARALFPAAGAEPPGRLFALGALSPAAVVLLLSAGWWCWHGVGGWGPRFLVPAIPLLAPWAALATAGFAGRSRALVLAASVLLNVPPLLLHPAIPDTFIANCRRAVVTESFAGTIPAPYVLRDASGKPTVTPENVLHEVPAASPWVVTPWLLRVSASDDETLRARSLERPPWAGERPDLGPRLVPLPPEIARVLAPPPRIGFLGRGFSGAGDDPVAGTVYLDALVDQALRALQLGRPERALALSGKLSRLSRGNDAATALQAESLRLLDRRNEAWALLESLPRERRSAPEVALAVALLARDRGDEPLARQALRLAVPAFRGTPAEAVLSRPLAEWPAGYAAMTLVPVEEVTPARPRVGPGR